MPLPSFERFMSEDQFSELRREIRGYIFKVVGGVIFLSIAFGGWMSKVSGAIDAAEKDRQEMHASVQRQADLNQYFVAHVSALEARQK